MFVLPGSKIVCVKKLSYFSETEMSTVWYKIISKIGVSSLVIVIVSTLCHADEPMRSHGPMMRSDLSRRGEFENSCVHSGLLG